MSSDTASPPSDDISGNISEAQQSAYPVLAQERNWGPIAFVGVASSLAAGTWLFPIGGAVASFVTAWPGTLLMLGGMMIGVGMLLVGTLPLQSKFGLDSVAATAPYLGVRGTSLGLVLVWLPIAAWNSILTIIMGRSLVRITNQVGLVHLSDVGISTWGNVVGALMLFGILMIVVAGPEILKRLEIILAIIAVVIVAIIFGMLFAKFGPAQIGSAQPLSPFGDHQRDYMTVLELMIATGLSWWPWVGGLVRLVPSARKALPGFLIGLGLTVPIVTSASLWSSLVAKDADPSSWMITVGGTAWGLVALILVVKANVGTIALNLFVSGVAANRIPVVQQRLGWTWNLLIACLPVVLIVLFFGDTFLAQTPKVLAFSGLFYAPLAGVGAADYFVLRRGRISLRGVYDTHQGAPYYFWRGVNPVGVVAVIAGVITYLLLLDPLTLEAHGPFKWITASIPAFIAAAAAHIVLTKVVVIPSRRGDYDASAPHDIVSTE